MKKSIIQGVELLLTPVFWCCRTVQDAGRICSRYDLLKDSDYL